MNFTLINCIKEKDSYTVPVTHTKRREHYPPSPHAQLEYRSFYIVHGMSLDPNFATVVLANEVGLRLATLRVPLSANTSVRQLAKDTMSRYLRAHRDLLKKISFARDPHRRPSASSGLGVIHVRAGVSEDASADIFAEDLVSQVVLLREESVFMCLRTGSMLEVEVSDHSSCTTATLSTQPLHSNAPSDDDTQPPAVNLLEQEQEGTSPLGEVPQTPATHVMPRCTVPSQQIAESTPLTVVKGGCHRLCSTSASGSSDSTCEDSSVRILQYEEVLRDAEQLRMRQRLGWGPEAYKNFAPNYVSSPQKLMRLRTKRQPVKRAKRADPGGRIVGSPSPLKMPATVAKMPVLITASPQQHLFASLKCSPKKATPAPPSPPIPSKVVRQLVFDSDLVNAAPEAVGLPSGWGPDACKSFDPETYCDDPLKAIISPKKSGQPIRARRNVQLPWYFDQL